MIFYRRMLCRQTTSVAWLQDHLLFSVERDPTQNIKPPTERAGVG
jgi:hypothetical protein